ncbi:RuBisCO large subunit C-terminal-like domain-containing protein [Vannielia litorea]|uniref:RuBisCO large subunit C-terminal-like domain-containing protein n=1 Tax=Vannielia litorea TaxID=1217970 RepID=UPI001BCD9494|nr:RuBisCO large subunit C-terminal-like domain-containing protein [Vannielia litorea]MBS8226884.1 hypothetical protein [Vannielia litorea]
MTDIRFDRLVDLPLRDAWAHEAHQFTPWLAENIDHLSETIGIPLELTGTEVAVETFSADILARKGGTCVMASLNWCGLSAMESLRAHTPLAIHGHRNGFGAMSRHPALGMGFPAYQALYRLAGVDHMHVHGIGGKFVDSAEEVTEAARACLAPLAEGTDDAVMPAFSSGQWAGTLGTALEAAGSADLMFMCGGGILAHPGGPAAGVASLRDAYAALSAGESLAQAAANRPALAEALDFFGKR